MPKVIFVSNSNSEVIVDASAGNSIMTIAVQNDVAGIIGECGGALSCCTCHVYVDNEWAHRIPPASEFEHEMLEMTASPRNPTSRLSCQIELTGDLDGIRIFVPVSQD